METISKHTILRATEHPDLRLKMIDEGDIESLRKWKNLNRESFFLKSEITADQQREWYAAFRGRPDDFMFVVEQIRDARWEKIGCMGFRVLDDNSIDAYNIIRSQKIEPSSFTMADVFRNMLAYANILHKDKPIRCKVLASNPAVSWYERNGFAKLEEKDGYFLMELDKSAIKDLSPVIDN